MTEAVVTARPYTERFDAAQEGLVEASRELSLSDLFSGAERGEFKPFVELAELVGSEISGKNNAEYTAALEDVLAKAGKIVRGFESRDLSGAFRRASCFTTRRGSEG